MQPHVMLAREVVYRWAEEMAKTMEEKVIVVAGADPVIGQWTDELSALLPEVKIRNTCAKIACIKTCYYCTQISREIERDGGKDLFINYASEKLLFVKMKEIRCRPLKRFTIERQVIDLFAANDEVTLVDCNDYQVLLPPQLFEFFAEVDREYLNPALMVQMVKYLEFEKRWRAGTEHDLEMVLHGLKVSFFLDPVLIETTRLNLFRQNNALPAASPPLNK